MDDGVGGLGLPDDGECPYICIAMSTMMMMTTMHHDA